MADRRPGTEKAEVLIMANGDKEKLKKMLDKIKGLEAMVSKLKILQTRLLSDKTDPANEARAAKVGGYIASITAFKEALDTELAKEAKTQKEKREKKEMIQSGYIFAAVHQMTFAGFTPDIAYINNYRIIDTVPEAKKTLSFTNLIQNIFDSKENIYVKPEQMEEILSNNKYEEMYKNNNTKYLDEKNAKVDKSMDEMVIRVAAGLSAKFLLDKNMSKEEAREQAAKIHVKRKNDFQSCYDLMKQKVDDEHMECDFKPIMEKMGALAAKLTKIQEDYVNLTTSNGYTKELIDEETELLNAVKQYNIKKQAEMEKIIDENPDRVYEIITQGHFMEQYSVMKSADFLVERQFGGDINIFENNERLREIEEYKVYKNYHDSLKSFDLKNEDELENEMLGWSKVQRLKKNSAGVDESAEYLTEIAMLSAQQLMKTLTKPGELNAEEWTFVKEKLAEITFCDMITQEYRDPGKKKSEYFEAYDNDKNMPNYNRQVKKMLNEPLFKEQMDRLGDMGIPSKEDIIEFIAKDRDINLAADICETLPKKEVVKRNDGLRARKG